MTSNFDIPSNNTDLVLLVEDRSLHVHRTILANASIVFDRMLQGDFKEKDSAEIPLPDKSYEDILEMLLCIYPSELKDVTRERVDVLLKLADEYQITSLTRRCERFLLSLCVQNVDRGELVHVIYLAQNYKLNDLFGKTIDMASQVTFKGADYDHPAYEPWDKRSKKYGLISEDDYKLLSDETLILYLSKRVHYLEVEHKIKGVRYV